MLNHKREFLEVWGNTKKNCVEIEALLHILKNYCEVNDEEDGRFFYIEVLLDIILHKNFGLREQINQIEDCSRYFIFDKL